MSFQQSHSLGFFSSNSLSSIQPVSPTQDIIPVPRPNYNQHRERPSRQLQSRQNSGRTHLLPGRSASGSGGYNGYESSSGVCIIPLLCIHLPYIFFRTRSFYKLHTWQLLKYSFKRTISHISTLFNTSSRLKHDWRTAYVNVIGC